MRVYFSAYHYSLSWLSRLAAAPRLSEGKMSIPAEFLVYPSTSDKKMLRGARTFSCQEYEIISSFTEYLWDPKNVS